MSWITTQHKEKLSHQIEYNKSMEDAKKGVLSNFGREESRNILINMGGVGTFSSVNDIKMGFNSTHFFECGSNEPFEIKFRNGKLMLNSKFYNFNNEIIGEIENNEWYINTNYYKRNYDSHAIEVIDNYDVVVMQVIYQGDVIQINGILHCGNRMLICNGDIALKVGNPPETDPNKTEKLKAIYLEEGRKIPRIFEYTGDNYLGRRKKI